MDISSVGNFMVDTTFAGAKYNKSVNELNEFEKALKEKQNDEKASTREDESLKEMCVEFEKYFLKEMYKSMKKTVNYDNFMTYGGQSEEIFSDMLDDRYIENAVSSGGIGLANKLYEQLKSPTSSIGSQIKNNDVSDLESERGNDKI